MDNNYCALLWNHFIQLQDESLAKPCCLQKTRFKVSGSIKETGNSELLKSLRKQVLENDLPLLGCEECYMEEKAKNTSARIESNRIWQDKKDTYIKNTQKDGTYENFYLERLDIRWSNLCNYKCRFCSLTSSSSWLQDHLIKYDLLEGYNPKTGVKEAVIDWWDLKKHLPHVRYVKLAGGEPFMMDGTYRLIEELIRLKKFDTHILVNTNASFVMHGNKNIIGMLKNFKNVNISLSIDGMNDVHGYLRSGKNDWIKVRDNIEKFIDSGLNVSFLSSVSWLNAIHMIKLLETYNNVEIEFNSVTTPKFMSLGYLTKSQFKQVLKAVEDGKITDKIKIKYKRWLKKLYVQTLINGKKKTELVNEFLFYINKLDETRKQNFCETFPEWKDIYEEVNSV